MTDTLPFQKLIQEQTGIRFEKSTLEILAAEIRNMVYGKGLKSEEEYYRLLLRDSKEFFEFLNLLTVNETYFFREEAHIRLFTQKLVPELLQKKSSGQKLRIFSAGCSTGEEVYSLVIALREKYGKEAEYLFFVQGADIDRRAVQKAREGIYSPRAFRMTGDPRREMWFTETAAKQFRVADSIRRQVRFSMLNLLSRPYPEELGQNDIIFYRNVSIYFDQISRKKIFRNLADTLLPGGYLIVSSTETLSHDYNILHLIQKDGVFLFRKGTGTGDGEKRGGIFPLPGKKRKRPLPAARKYFMHSPGNASDCAPGRFEKTENRPGRQEKVPLQQSDSRESENVYQQAAAAVQKKEYAKALACLNRLLRAEPSHIRAASLKAAVLLNQGKSEEAGHICEDIIKQDSLFMEAYFLLGLIANTADRKTEALKRFREASYICPGAWPPHFYSARISQTLGDREKAVREYGTVLRILEQGGFRKHGLSFFPFAFSEEDIRHLCRYNREKIVSDPVNGAKGEKNGI